MNLAIAFLPLAEAEIEAASLWYEEQSPGLGLRFLLAIDAVLLRAAENPLAFPKVLRRTRKAVIRRFLWGATLLDGVMAALSDGLFRSVPSAPLCAERNDLSIPPPVPPEGGGGWRHRRHRINALGL